PREHLGVVRELFGLPGDPDAVGGAVSKLGSGTNIRMYETLVLINVFWGFINLLPVWPLDGGRVSEIVFSYFNPRDGARWGHILSLLVAALTALFALSRSEMFLTVFFGYFAFANYQILQTLHQAQMMGIHSDEDWWRR